MINGKLILIGGTEDRSKNIEIFQEICDICKPKSILVIPSAVPISISEQLGQEYQNIFMKLLPNCNCDIMDVQSVGDLNKTSNIDLVKRSDMFFFTGGSQQRLSRIFKNTYLLSLMLERLQNSEVSMVGTSAGASAMGEMVLYSDHELVNDGKINVEESFSLLPRMIIDSHTLERQRIYRLAKTIFLHSKFKGIGLSEDSGILVENNKMYALGNKPTILISSSNLNVEDKELEPKISMEKLETAFLTNGSEFDMQKWEMC